jgi:cation diffusion facilitator CzcD-associated flavoprotein CzcO
MVERKRAIIVGGGLGGVCAGIHLLKAGIGDFVILERENEPGGTWRDNTYPGCACDVPVALYQFSFAPSLHWRHIFPRAAEMKQYIDQLVSGFGLTPHFRGGDGAQAAAWDDDRCRWRITKICAWNGLSGPSSGRTIGGTPPSEPSAAFWIGAKHRVATSRASACLARCTAW